MCFGILLALVGVATADPPRPSLDDFYERTRERDDGFTNCIGYCDGRYLAALMIGAETANPSNDALQPELATGIRLGADIGLRTGNADLARSQLWADVLRVNANGNWITDLGWHTTAFDELGTRGHGAVDVQFDGVLARRTELQLSDVAELQQQPYTLADVEAEVAPTGPYLDKDSFLALPIGVANRLRWSDGMTMDRRTEISGAIVARGFPKQLRHHAQLDFVRIKHTDWNVAGGRAGAWTLSTGYQHLPDGIDTLPIWALLGYEWAGARSGVVAQLGGALRFGHIEIGPSYESHFEIDPRTATFARVSSGKLRFRQRVGPIRYGLALEALSIEARGSLEAVSPELGVLVHGVELGLRYRFVRTQDVMFPAERFNVSLDWQL